MKLKKEYEQFSELYNNKIAFDPENEKILVAKGKKPILPELFKDWKIESFDFKEYGLKRLEELGVTEDNNIIELIGGVGLGENEKCEQRIFNINSWGDIEILQFGLDRKVLLKQDPKERYCFQKRLHPWHVNVVGDKYDFVNAQNSPFWSPSLIEMFENETECETLTITEGQIKAWKACQDGIPTVALTSISHFKKEGKIHAEIIQFIKTCKVKNIIVLWDGDCRDISLKALENNEDLTKRPNSFFQYARSIKNLIHEFAVARKTRIYFATIQSDALRGAPKGIDDLLIEFQQQKVDVINDWTNIGSVPGKYIEWIDISSEIGQKKMRRFFKLHSDQEFYEFHKEKIRDKSFIYYGSTYRIEKGRPIIEVSKDVKSYKRIGPDFFRIIADGTYNDDGELIKREDTLVPWKIAEFARDYGKEATMHIERYDGFTNVASHVDYKQVVDNKWNLYNDLNHETSPGEWTNIQKLIKHIFKEQYEMALDYMTLLYTKPYQKLPVLCLVSKEEGTGKSTFIKLLQFIFQNNMALVSSEDIMGSWTSHWVSKLLVASEETFFEKKEALEKIKNLSTTSSVMRSERFVNNKMIPCILKFVFASNHEDDFIKLNKNSSRFWVIKVDSVDAKDKNTNMDECMRKEIPAFLHFILNRPILHPKRDRMWFSLDQIITEAFRNVVKHSEPTIIKEIREKLEENFLKFGGTSRALTVENLKQHFGIKGEDNYISKTIRSVLQVEKHKNLNGQEAVTTYSFPVEDSTDPTATRTVRGKGRPFIFPVEMFVSAENMNFIKDTKQTEIPLEDIKEPSEPKDDLPF